jgi:predicted amidohydrolase
MKRKIGSCKVATNFRPYTDFGKIGILICYDVEFPELGRLLADQEIQILFIPFWTDTKNGYLRVRICAQARAIENECYVAIAGSVGNLPKVDNVDIQYGQSAVFSPSDFAFPHDAIVSETTPNTDTNSFVSPSRTPAPLGLSLGSYVGLLTSSVRLWKAA